MRNITVFTTVALRDVMFLCSLHVTMLYQITHSIFSSTMGIPFIGSSVKVGKYGKIVMNDR